MDNERGTSGGRGFGRWMVVAVLIAAGATLFFVYGRGTQPAIEPSIQEAAP